MHELAVCQALLDDVASLAESRGALAVTDVHVGIGPLSGVEADLLADAFPIATAGSVAEDARLHLRQTGVSVYCEACGEETDAFQNRLVCGICGTWRTRLVSGDELVLERVAMSGIREGEANNV